MNVFDIIPFMPNKHRIETVWRSLREKIRGLDFTLPDRMQNRHRNDGAMYYASPEEILREIFSKVDLEKYSRFLDVGCGKGYVVWQAKRFGFSQVGGIEYDEKLYKICRQNLRRLGLSENVDIYCDDACEFTQYKDYNVFYFFNPFGDEMMRKVIGRILVQCRGSEILLVYYRPRYTGAIEECGYFRRTEILYDQTKNYEVYFYSGKIPE